MRAPASPNSKSRRRAMSIIAIGVGLGAILAAIVHSDTTPLGVDRWAWQLLAPHRAALGTVIPLGGARGVAFCALGVAACALATRDLPGRVIRAMSPLVTGAATWVLVDQVTKPLVGREIGAGAWAWPSGHAAGLAALSGCAAMILAGRARVTVSAALGAGSVLVGTAMVARRSHYLTDALGGWALGLACGLAIGTAAVALAQGRD